MGQIIRLIIRDKKTGKRYKTENHNDNLQKDDFHRDIKRCIIKRLGKSIIKKYGENGNIEVDDGKIIYVSQMIDEYTGRRKGISIKTDIDVNDFFEEITMLFVNESYKISQKLDIDLTFKVIKNSEQRFEILVNRNKILVFDY